MPRGGSGNNVNNNEKRGVATDLYYQELSEQILMSDEAATSSEEMELGDNSEDYCDVEVDESETTDGDLLDTTGDGTDVDEDDEPLDPILDALDAEEEESIIPRFLSPQHLTTTLPSNLIQFANLVIQVAKRSLVAGARAIMVDNDIEEQEESSSPVVRTLVGKTAFVLGEMYHAARTTSDVEKGTDEGNRRHHRRRRRRRSTTAPAGSPSRHRHRRRERYTTSPTEVVCNGGGMEPYSSSDRNAQLLNLAQKHNINLPTDDNDTNLPQKYDSILLNSETTLKNSYLRVISLPLSIESVR